MFLIVRLSPVVASGHEGRLSRDPLWSLAAAAAAAAAGVAAAAAGVAVESLQQSLLLYVHELHTADCFSIGVKWYPAGGGSII